MKVSCLIMGALLAAAMTGHAQFSSLEVGKSRTLDRIHPEARMPAHLMDKVIGWFRFDHNDGTNYYDLATAGRNANSDSISVQPLWTTNGGVTCLKFDGVNDRAGIPACTSMNNLTNLTMMCWVKREGNTYLAGILSRYKSSLQYVHLCTGFSSEYGGYDDLFFRVGYSSRITGYTSANVLPLNTWSHITYWICLTNGTTATRMKCFVNGVQKPIIFTNTGTPANTGDGQTATAWWGYQTQDNITFNGYINDVVFLRDAISSNDVYGIFNLQKGAYGL